MAITTIFNKIWYYIIFLIATFPLFGIRLESFFIILFSLLSFVLIIAGGKASFKKKNIKWLLIFSLVYLIYLISALFYPLDRAAVFVLEKKLGLLIFPMIFFLIPNDITKEHCRKLLLGFTLSSIGIAVYTNALIFIKGIPLEYLSIHDFSYSYRTFFEDISGIHPTYISIYLAFSALILIDYSFKKKKELGWYGIAFVVCILCMLPHVAKLPMFAFIVSLGLYLFIQPFIWKKARFLFFTLLACILIASFTVPSMKIRINEIMESSFSPPQNTVYNSINVRSGIWQCSISLIKDNWILGVGAGQIEKQLDNCYSRFDTNAFSSRHYNTHNEYFNVILGTGVLGFFAFLLMLTAASYQSYKIRNPLFFSLMILLILCFFTENLLDRQGGVVFFAFFTSLLTRTYIIQEKKP